MFKMLIVDDERLDREGLKDQIDWHRFGIISVDTARNGFEAFEMIEALKPDILLTDVKMPGMSGLELAQKATEAIPWIKVIFISGYDDFEYVRNALLINAYEYILKPVDSEELESAIEKVTNERLKEKRNEEETLLLKRRIDESKPLLKLKFLKDLIYGTAGRDGIGKNIEFPGMNIGEGPYRILLSEIDDYKLLGEYTGGIKPEAAVSSMEAVFLGLHTGDCLIEFGQIEPSRYAAILSFNGSADMENIDRISSRLSSELIKEVKDHAALSITVGMGSLADCLEKIHCSYSDACRALSQKMFKGKGTVLQFFPTVNAGGQDIDIQNVADGLIQCIRASDANKAYHLVDYLFDNLECLNFSGDKYIHNVCINIISRMEIVLLDMNVHMENIFGGDVMLWDKLMKFETIIDIRQWMKNVFKDIFDYFELKNLKKNRKIISEIVAHIEGNFSKELTLKDIAAEFFYSPNYLGAMFKDELGMGFFEYLTEVRMKKAAEFLKLPRLKMYEVANMVGYKNISSFINQFKLSYNMTPTEFRERC